MKTQIVKITDEIEVEISNTLRDNFARVTLAGKMPNFGDIGDFQGYVDLFIGIAAHTKSVKGLDWSPPPLMATEDELTTSFEQLLSVTGVGVLAAWGQAITNSVQVAALPDEQETAGENPITAALENES